MDNRFDPSRDTPSTAEEPMDLGQFTPFQISDHTPQKTIIERAMAGQPVPRALRDAPTPPEPELLPTAADHEQPQPYPTPAFLERQTNGPEPKEEPRKGWLARLRLTNNAPTETPQAAANANDDEKSPRGPLFTRRNVLLGGLGGAVVGTGLYKGIDTLWGRSNTPMALLKMDPEAKQLGLVHRRADFSLLKYDEREGADALSFTNNNLESLVLSPELALKLKQDEATIFRGSDDKNNTDGQFTRLENTPRNIYMPYHLFAGAASFSVFKRMEQEYVPYKGELQPKPGEYYEGYKGQDVHVVLHDYGTPLKEGERLRKLSDGGVEKLIPLGTHHLKDRERIENVNGEIMKTDLRPKLVISISGPHAKKDLPIAKDIANAAESAKEVVTDTLGGVGSWASGAWDDFKDWSGIGGDGIDTRAAEAARHDAEKLARERAKPHPQESADFRIDMDYPTDGILPNLHFYNGRTLEPANYHIMGEEIAAAIAKDKNFGMRIITNNGVNYNDANDHIGQHVNTRYYNKELRQRANAAMLHPDSNIEDGVLKNIGTDLKKFAITDNKLNSYEEAALTVASDHIERSEDGRWTFKDRFAHRVIGTPDQNIGR